MLAAGWWNQRCVVVGNLPRRCKPDLVPESRQSFEDTPKLLDPEWLSYDEGIFANVLDGRWAGVEKDGASEAPSWPSVLTGVDSAVFMA